MEDKIVHVFCLSYHRARTRAITGTVLIPPISSPSNMRSLTTKIYMDAIATFAPLSGTRLVETPLLPAPGRGPVK